MHWEYGGSFIWYFTKSITKLVVYIHGSRNAKPKMNEVFSNGNVVVLNLKVVSWRVELLTHYSTVNAWQLVNHSNNSKTTLSLPTPATPSPYTLRSVSSAGASPPPPPPLDWSCAPCFPPFQFTAKYSGAIGRRRLEISKMNKMKSVFVFAFLFCAYTGKLAQFITCS